MSLWFWIVLAVGLSLAASLLAGMAVAQILRSVGAEASELLAAEAWQSAPLTREAEGGRVDIHVARLRPSWRGTG